MDPLPPASYLKMLVYPNGFQFPRAISYVVQRTRKHRVSWRYWQLLASRSAGPKLLGRYNVYIQIIGERNIKTAGMYRYIDFRVGDTCRVVADYMPMYVA